MTLLAVLLAASALAEPPPKPSMTMSFLLQDNLIRLDGVIDGDPAAIVLDSGTSALLLDKTFASRHGALKRDPIGSGLGGGQGPQAVYPAQLKSLAVGPFDAGGLPAYAMDFGALSRSAGFQIDALFGRPAFAARWVRIDYPARRVTFGLPGEAARCASPIPLKLLNGVPVVEVRLTPAKGAPPVLLHMIVDLGTRHSLALIGGPFLTTQAGAKLLSAGRAGKIGTGTGGEVGGVFAHPSRLRMGPLSIASPEVGLTTEVKAFETGAVDGTLGVPLWKGGAITFDYPHQRVCIEPGPPPARP